MLPSYTRKRLEDVGLALLVCPLQLDVIVHVSCGLRREVPLVLIKLRVCKLFEIVRELVDTALLDGWLLEVTTFLRKHVVTCTAS